MRPLGLAVVAVLAVTAATGGVAASDNAAPLAEAGLDQTVTQGTTVYLDANGSRDPDGAISAVSWTIHEPDGDAVAPDCRTCRQTRFRPDAVGRYTVSLSVTDDDGATRSDSMYVTVEASSSLAVALSTPATTRRGRATTLSVDATATDADLATLAWVVDGAVVNQSALSGHRATTSTTHSFDSGGPHSVQAVVYDTLGRRGNATQTVTVVGRTNRPSGRSQSTCPDGSQPHWFADGNGGHTPLCSDAADIQYQPEPGGETVILDANGREGVQLYVDGQLRSSDALNIDLDTHRTSGGAISRGSVVEAMEVAVNDLQNQNKDQSEESGHTGGHDIETPSDQHSSNTGTGWDPASGGDDSSNSDGCTPRCGGRNSGETSDSGNSGPSDDESGSSSIFDGGPIDDHYRNLSDPNSNLSSDSGSTSSDSSSSNCQWPNHPILC
ncbi:PKD domain-containing protein [Haloarcula marina]|uniref:PKD domain-containing protein n=1 Tax=Haloarcula marina TaxID=2961574 RepID=UPI0020B8DD96|nr:PKD domain-containing protein [Halomicroarcula marina]